MDNLTILYIIAALFIVVMMYRVLSRAYKQWGQQPPPPDGDPSGQDTSGSASTTPAKGERPDRSEESDRSGE